MRHILWIDCPVALFSLGLLLVLPTAGMGATLTVGPGQSITTALKQMKGGDTLLVKAGTYNETIRSTIPSGTQSAPTTVKSEVPHRAILRPDKNQPRQHGGIVTFGEGATQHWITFEGFVLDAAQLGPEALGLVVGGDSQVGDMLIVGNEIKNIAGGNSGNNYGIMYATKSTGVVIRSNTIHDIGLQDTANNRFWSYGIYLAGQGLLFEGNELYKISGYPIHGYAGGCCVSNNIVRDNYIHDTGAPVLLCHEKNQIYNNVLARVAQGPAFQRGGIQTGGAAMGRSRGRTLSTTIRLWTVAGPVSTTGIARAMWSGTTFAGTMGTMPSLGARAPCRTIICWGWIPSS